MRTPRRIAALAVAFLSVAAAALVAPSSSGTAVGDCTPGSTWPAARTDLAGGVLALINAHRATVGAPALVTSTSLTAAAVWKARHMAMYQYMAHDDPAPPVARSTLDRIAACGYAGAGWGENIAYGYSTPQAVVAGWLGSPGHRANIEQRGFLSTGIGAAVGSSGAVYWAQTFGTSTAGSPPPPPPPPPTTTTTTTTTSTTTTTTTPAPPPPPPPPVAPPPPPGKATSSPAARIRLARSPDRRSPRPDRRFTLRFPVVGTNAKARGPVECHAQVGHRTVRVLAEGVRRGYAQCIFAVPRHTRGHRVWGTVQVKSPSGPARRWFSRVVR
ncbi:MAG: CAP domain-containing protein [Gaiellaceae bacterium]